MMRPEGQPGTTWFGDEHDSPWDGERVKAGLSYPAVLDDEGVMHNCRDGQGIESPGYEPFF
ncbi:MAG: hypothetical protein HOU01_18315, partial [Streptomycetaceae bacterium]|nr:hypothetical protein [Streptomycetaceae bacterium]